MLKKTFKILLIILGVAIVAGLIALLTIKRGWPWWVGLTIMAGTLGLVMGLFFLKRYYMRRREKKFVRRIVDLDDAAIKTAPLRERQQLQDLQLHWKESVDLLHASYLRKQGNPLYVLPWYLIIGESGTGKTSAINNARLSSPLTEMGRKGPIPSTRNCDWWFFKEAILLDSAGRYAIPIDETKDREEWEKFLVLLARYRRREPLNGLIVSVSADNLKAADPDKLREDGQNIRKRIDQLMRVVGAKFPVYLLVTKMDLVYGFMDFFDTLPESEMSQAMGCLNRSLHPYWREFLEKAWADISLRLRDLRLAFLGTSCGKVSHIPPCLMFPNEFDKLKPGLIEFSQAVFEENPYQETPLFRGLYFSSAAQEGRPQSEFLDFMHGDRFEICPPEITTRKDRCLFLVDFFKSILPGDRSLFRPILEFIRWRRVTNSIALMAWLLICLALCGFLTISFIHNRMVINKFKTEFARLPALANDIASDPYFLEKLRLEILDMEKANRYWFIASLGLTESRELEAAMKRRYVQIFEPRSENRFDGDLLRNVSDIGAQTPEGKVADYISYVVARINVLDEYVKSGNVTPAEVFKRSAADILVSLYPRMSPGYASLYADNYYAFLTWRGDRRNAQAKLDLFLGALLDLQRNTVDLKWLVNKWIPAAPPVTLKDFWGEPEGTGYDEQVTVPGAYTILGRKHIESFIAMIETALPDKNILLAKKSDFWTWYQQQYLKSWAAFARHFNDGGLTLQTSASQQNAAVLMTTDRNPYFRLIERITDEMAWIPADQAPPWVAMFIEFNEVKKLAKSETKKTQGSLLDKLSGGKEKLAQELKAEIDKKSLDANNKREAMAKVWQDYVVALDKISPVATSREVGYRMTADFFTLPSDTTQPSNATIYLAYSNYLKMKSLVQVKGDLSEVWDTILGPTEYLLSYCIKQTACYLKKQWDGQVLGGLEGASKDKYPRLLFDPTAGLVWKFINGPAKPFIGKNKSGYTARRASIKEGVESAIPFTADFLEFLNAGAEGVINYQPEYLVQMETLPITVNDDAALDPYGNILTLQCTDGQVDLKNFNYPQKAVFRWTPDKCTDATVQIRFSDMTLTKVYKGRMGFANFLAEFKDGSHTFIADDFAEFKSRLTRLGISSIKVSYKINGSKPVMQLLKEVPSQVPQSIAVCGD